VRFPWALILRRRYGVTSAMDRRRKMLKKRRRLQRLAEEETPGVRLIFAEGYAATKGKRIPGDKDEPPPAPEEQP